MSWDIQFTQEAAGWYRGLNDAKAERFAAAVNRLEQGGPVLGRPAVDSITGSRHANMKELRSFGQNLRGLFAFDRQRRAIVLVGGEKTNDWRGFYERAIPKADRLFDGHLRNTGQLIPWRELRAGRNFESRER